MVHFPGLARLTKLGTADSKAGQFVSHGIDMLSDQLHSNSTGVNNSETPYDAPQLPRLSEVDEDW